MGSDKVSVFKYRSDKVSVFKDRSDKVSVFKYRSDKVSVVKDYVNMQLPCKKVTSVQQPVVESHR